MSSNRAQEVLYESEAALRLVDHELDLLGTLDDASHARPARDSGELAAIVEQVAAHINALRSSIHDGRSLLQAAQHDEQAFASLATSIFADMERRLSEMAQLVDATGDVDQSNNDQIFPEVQQPAA